MFLLGTNRAGNADPEEEPAPSRGGERPRATDAFKSPPGREGVPEAGERPPPAEGDLFRARQLLEEFRRRVGHRAEAGGEITFKIN